ncbi:hypothetical protein F5I97DRAFT_2065263 [Phlebopus sp. FC_14]|nr:hypothetical protein F5I97DRAFT_2065263 [Phlebopus sp. FC_14]
MTMSEAENAPSFLDLPPQQPSSVDAISDGLSNVSLPEDSSLNSLNSSTTPQPQTSPQNRPFVMYSRSQLLFLHKSPLVKIPSGMPALKDWFGIESEQINAKKDSEVSVPPSNTRRFRRDGEDGSMYLLCLFTTSKQSKGSLRTSFRGTAVTQPSQMGNFKHQSIRDRDRDVDREQDRDMRLKEGQERLRNLSDKYDRDRRALSSLSQMRPKDREPAPHLSNPSTKVSSQGQQMVSGRAADAREPLRKKDGETSDDWRKGVEQPRPGRDRPENIRRDRDDRDRERPRSRVRDPSRARRDDSLSKRDDRRTDREDGFGAYRRDRDERGEFDRDSEADDPRRWRDDGKRDERMAARRERDIRERERDRDLRDRVRDKPPAWDGADRSDRRWTGDDRDSRGKRPSGRDRRDDPKDREDRKDREREKEPAWMDTYIPSNGGQRAVGELDGIQAFKKELREREQKDKFTSAVDPSCQVQAESPLQPLENQLDEIQLFKLMMKREEEKKKSESSLAPHSPHASQSAPSTDASPQDYPSRLNPAAAPTPPPALPKNSQAPSPSVQQPDTSAQGNDSSKSRMPGPLVSSPQTPAVIAFARKELDTMEKLKPANSRLFTTPLSVDPSAPQATEAHTTSSQVSPAHPPSGSRLLALKSRTPQNPVVSSTRSVASQSPVSFSQRNAAGLNQVVGAGLSLSSHLGENLPQFSSTTDDQRPSNGFSPFEERDGSGPTLPSESSTPNFLAFGNDRNVFAHDNNDQPMIDPGLGTGIQSTHSSQYEAVSAGVAAAKGSRFAKFFDNKGKEQSAGLAKNGAVNLGLNAPQKMDLGGLLPPNNPDARAMEDIFAMLNNSAHAQRVNTAAELSTIDIGHYGSSTANLHSMQNPRPSVAGHSRLDPLYESRLDDRNFMPDGMVPGLRSVPPPPRSRHNSTMFSEFPDDPIQLNAQRAPAPLFQAPMPSIHLPNSSIGRGGMPIQPTQYRGGSSPNPLAPAQRLPPGLANLGGRPPHEPNQFVNSSMGMTNGGIHGPLHGTSPAPQPFNSYQQAAGLSFGGGSQMRVPHPAGPHQLPGPLGPNPLQGLVHPGNLASSQAPLLGLAGVTGVPVGLRGPNGAFGQQGLQVQPPQMSLRQQQQLQQVPPHMLPPHMQQQGFGGGASNQPDLMSLLMNGGRRD